MTAPYAPDPADVDERIRRYRAEMIDQGLLFPAIHREYTRYRDDRRPLRDLQHARLADLLAHALTRVPVYRALGTDPDAARSDPWAVLAGWPPVTKADVRSRLIDHCDDEIDPAQCRFVQTSGTTGEPLRVVHDVPHVAHAHALALRRIVGFGLPFDRKVLHPYHTSLDRWFEYTAPAHGFARIAEFGASGDDAYWADIVDRVRGYRPEVVVGHPTRCVELADLLSAAGAVGQVRPRLIMTWGERLTPVMVARLRDCFAAPISDMYGIREVGTVAAQCPRGRYHVEAERLWVEVLDANGRAVPDGTTGEIVVTNLVNRAMPLIRYRTGDLGALGGGGCDCGVPGPVMTIVEGREPGDIVLPDGSRVPVLPIVRLMQALPIERHQVVQTAVDQVTVIVKPAPGFTDEHATRLRRDAARMLGAAVRLHLDTSGGFIGYGRRKATDFVPLAAGVAPADQPSPGGRPPGGTG